MQIFIGEVKKNINNPLFSEDKIWEPRFDNLYANIFFEEKANIYRCWYSPFIIDKITSSIPRNQRASVKYISAKPNHREMAVCYAFSKDGILWKKPDLNLIEFRGSKKNNIVYRGQQNPELWSLHGTGVLKDLNDPDPARRYKFFFRNESHMAVAFSHNGINWSPPRNCPEIKASGDTHNNTFLAYKLNKYIGITRLWDPIKHVRLIGRTESFDFLKWIKAVEILRALPSEPHRQTYAMIVFQYADLYLGLIMMLNTDTDTVDCELAWSPDTILWERLCPGIPLIPRGPEGSYDCGCIYAAAYPIFRNDNISLYYGGNNGPHSYWRDGFFCLAHLRPDGFAGLEPINREIIGKILTKPVECSGKYLRVTADAYGGVLRVGLLNTKGIKLDDSQPITANVTDKIVKWKDRRNLSEYVTNPIQLQFELKSVRLYSFSFSM